MRLNQKDYAVLEQLINFWHNFLSLFDVIQEENIAITVYLFGMLIALWLWFGVAKRLPNPIGGISWVILFACIATPTISEGDDAGLAPALIGLIFGILTKENSLILTNLMSIVFVAGLGFLIGFLWSKYQTAQKKISLNKSKKG